MANTIAETFPTWTEYDNKPYRFGYPNCGAVNYTYECKDASNDWVLACGNCWSWYYKEAVDELYDSGKIKTKKTKDVGIITPYQWEE